MNEGFSFAACLSRLRHPPPRLHLELDPMRMGYVGRNSETEPDLGADGLRSTRSATVDCYSPRWFLQYTQSAVRPRAGFRTSPKRVFMLRLLRVWTDEWKQSDRRCPAQRPNIEIRDLPGYR